MARTSLENFVVNSSEYDHDYFISSDGIHNKRTFGYRSGIIGNLANMGVNVSDELLDKVFGPIDEELFKFYREVFPLSEKKGAASSKNLTIKKVEGVVSEIAYANVGPLHQDVVLYTIAGLDGQIYRAGLHGTENFLQLGKNVIVKFDESDSIARHEENLRIPLSSGGSHIHPISKIWFRLVEYEKQE